MYLEDRDIEKTMDIYFTAWKKGVKSTYYLHMKPRHTAEQSTVTVNKSAKLGKTGFASVFRKTEEPIAIKTHEPVVSLFIEPVREEVIEKESFETAQDRQELAVDKKVVIEPLAAQQEKPISHQIFSKVQTQLEPAHKENEHYQVRIIDGKTYVEKP